MFDDQAALIILGDWVVDEYWYLASHISERSSHTGFVHYRVSSNREDMVSELCGAGRVARTLFYQINSSGDSKPKGYRIHGLGNWSTDDTETIRHLVHARNRANRSVCNANLARYRLRYKTCDERFPVTLRALYKKQPTIRVVRLYHELGDGLTQINRVDWEPEARKRSLRKKWRSGLPAKNKVKYIIVHDLGKGAVTPEVVRHLERRYKNAQWFVRSKVKKPKWLPIVKKKLLLNLIGPEVTSMLHPTESLLINGNPPSQIMDALRKMPGQNRFLLSDNREIAGLVQTKGKEKKLVTGRTALDPSQINELGWPSSFFASLISHLIETLPDIPKDAVLGALKGADAYSGVPLPQRIVQRMSPPSQKTVSVSFNGWTGKYKRWTDSSQRLGLIERKNKPDRLDVWRSFWPLSNYVACIRKKQKILSEMGRALRDFKKAGDGASPLSIMLQADPGTGKTYLAKMLADAYGFRFVPFDVTQMLKREELLDLFGEITTRQAKDGARLLVFVDEINALLEGIQVFSSFLTPLESGYYVRRGRTFKINPCVWIFAGTRMDDKERDKLRKAEKLSDLESRMTLQRSIDYSSLEAASGFREEFYAQARLEQVYLGALMIRRQHPDVHTVTREVLKYFHGLNPAGKPARRIRKLVAGLRNVQYGRVSRKNCVSWNKTGWPRKSKKNSGPIKLNFGSE